MVKGTKGIDGHGCLNIWATWPAELGPRAEAFRMSEVTGARIGAMTCAFCRGRGFDPFGIPSPVSTCCVCGGKGMVRIGLPRVPCRFCRGTGVYPHSRLTCTACGGGGAHFAAQRTSECPNCLGRGVQPASTSGFYCWTCHGSGVVGGRAEHAVDLAPLGGPGNS